MIYLLTLRYKTKKMKTKLLLLLALTFGLTIQAQTYQFSIQQNTGYNFSIVATPDFSKTTPFPTISQLGFTVMVPDGVTVSDATAPGGLTMTPAVFPTLGPTLVGVDAIIFSGNFDPRESLGEHVAGTPIVIATFDVLGSPTTGDITLLDNADEPVTLTGGQIFRSFMLVEPTGSLTATATDLYVGQTGTVSYSFATLSVPQNELTGYSIFPNPATDVVTIKGLENTLSSVEVFNIAGQRVYNSTSNMETINVNALEAGVYFVKLSTETASLTTKLIKQ